MTERHFSCYIYLKYKEKRQQVGRTYSYKPLFNGSLTT